MNKAIRILVVAAAASLLGGCIAQRTASSLKETPGAEGRLAGLQFRVLKVEPAVDGAATNLQSSLQAAYPALFSDDPRAIPLVVRNDSRYESQMVGAVLTGLTLGIVPLPVSYGSRYDVGVTAWGAQGAVTPESSVQYAVKAHEWMTIFTPLGFIPIPGSSDISRRSALVMDTAGMEAYEKKRQAFREDQFNRAVLSALARSDLVRLRAYGSERQAMPVINVDIEGRRYEGFLLPSFSNDVRQPGGADQYTLVLRLVGGGDGITRYDLPVAVRDAGGWQARRHYLMRSSHPLLAATALLEGGVPTRAVVTPVENPPLADFTGLAEAPGNEVAWIVRWSNGILLQIKNSSLPAELRTQSLPELQQLTTTLESTLLDLNERTTRANDRAQQAIEKGANPEPLREVATVLRQRSEILRAVLASVRQEAAARGAP